ncbi:hypothetical protein L6164_023566 [Bauhinia variegata]|uniref:Uncharacterized protein n=1 Tax=Bauhinia variegata TaxID=167791 RepID=A0ACB9MIK7_BAUVA|nr:hypothetical protein L6164_023566 [Bauhinia variegata]
MSVLDPLLDEALRGNPTVKEGRKNKKILIRPLKVSRNRKKACEWKMECCSNEATETDAATNGGIHFQVQKSCITMPALVGGIEHCQE